MKKLLSILLISLFAVSAFAGCGQTTSTDSKNDDLSYVENKKELVMGITYFEPMSFKDSNGEMTGFETEFSQAVCEKLGLKANFQKIDWDSKEVELNAKTIDCIWNGLTITDERKENMEFSMPYMENKQVMVVKNSDVDKYTTADALSGAKVVAEKKSAGEEVAKGDEFFTKANYTAVDSQAKALLEVKSGTADIAVIDYVMSIGSIGEDTDYSDLTIVTDKSFAEEQYGVAFRKGSTELTEKVNAAIKELAQDGTLEMIAKKYKLQDLLLVK